MNNIHTVVVARKIKPGSENDYERWVGKVISALGKAPGYQGMTAISSPDADGSVGIILIRFLSAEALSAWENSAIRDSLIEEGIQFSASYYDAAGGGREVFFSMPGMSSVKARWKMCLLTIPTVYLLFTGTLVALLRIVPSAADWPIPIRMLLVVPVVVVLLTYVCLPSLSRVVAPWLFSGALPWTGRSLALKS